MVQHPVLLTRAYESGIVGRAWRILKSWYSSPSCRVRIDRMLSEPFMLERGVLQGSVLSPTLFFLIIDPLLKVLESNCLGPELNGHYFGAFAHCDDIRTICSSRDTLDKQITSVEKFVDDNALVLNASKCEVVVISASPNTPICSVAKYPVIPSDSAKINVLVIGGAGICLQTNQRTLQLAEQDVVFCFWSYG